ncbi:HlyD family efflux transporter periplasmic adaptor subunit [Lyngbya confervoides]|uniref:HlyD family efflux transporter periplasmic adaptor subunit n=1 Tax=Lyngbya confervoides BDU141951 TaxID=1574623 RepID=A0ABD4T8T4_9CYAN|nr:HlyD family efflux transporter periplasmic adaptor subunit [Lyngbya confervoides]MCM1984844.1 HlyD family efflux transporter periplasmic adaptor subunit [Lyngbya confervoides BDU141951]
MIHDTTDQWPKPELERYRWSVLLTTLAVALGGVSLFALQHYSKTAAINAEVQKKSEPLIATVTAPGRLQPQGEVVNLSAPSAAGGRSRVLQLRVKEGDTLRKGQIVAVLDSRDRLQADVDEAKSQVAMAQAKLAQVRAGVRTGEVNTQLTEIAKIKADIARNEADQRELITRLETQYEGDLAQQNATLRRLEAAFRNAALEYERYDRLYGEGVVSNAQRDGKRLSYETAQQQVSEAQAAIERTTATAERQIQDAKARLVTLKAVGDQQLAQAKANVHRVAEVRPVDIRAAQAEVEQAQATLKQAEVKLEEAYVRSPQDGTVLEILTRPGEVIGREGIAEIGQTDHMYAIAEIYQSDIFKIQPGQRATVTSDSLHQNLTGTVERVDTKIQPSNRISADPTAPREARIVEVHIQLDRASSDLAKNLTNLQIKAAIEL